MNGRGNLEVLPGGFTMRRVADGLFEWTHTTEDGVTAGLVCLAELVDILRDYGMEPAA